MQVNVLVFEKENLEDIPTYDQIYASDVVRRMFICVCICVCPYAYLQMYVDACVMYIHIYVHVHVAVYAMLHVLGLSGRFRHRGR